MTSSGGSGVWHGSAGGTRAADAVGRSAQPLRIGASAQRGLARTGASEVTALPETRGLAGSMASVARSLAKVAEPEEDGSSRGTLGSIKAADSLYLHAARGFGDAECAVRVGRGLAGKPLFKALKRDFQLAGGARPGGEPAVFILEPAHID